MNNIIFHQDIAVFPRVFNPDICERLIRTFEDADIDTASSELKLDERLDHSKGFVGFNQNKDLKDTKILLIKCLREYAKKYVGLYQYGLISDECKIQKTPIYGGFHSWHHEHSLTTLQSRRVLVWMIYLNDLNPGDGTTEFLYQNLEYTPEQGTLLIWPAYYNYLHRGNPPREKIKYIATGWWHSVAHTHPLNELQPSPDWNKKEDFFSAE